MALLAYCIECNTEYSMKKHHKTGCPKCGAPFKACKRFRVNVTAPGGKRIAKTVNGNLSLARRVEAKLKTEASQLKHLGIRKAPLITEVWEKYAEWTIKNKKDYRHDIGRWKWHVEPFIQRKRMDQLMANDVQTILDKMVKYTSGYQKKQENTQDKKDSKTNSDKPTQPPERNTINETHAPATIKQVLVLIKRVYNWAIQQQLYYGQNPAEGVQAPKVDNEKTECLTEEQVNKLLAVIQKWPNRRAALIVKFAMYTGLRLDEILGLEWKETDLLKGFVKLTDPKGKPTTLPISAGAITILHEIKDLLPTPDCPYAFPNKHGGRRVSFHKIWTRIRNKAGIPKGFRFHDLRHTFASYLASSGEVDIYTLQKLLNHQTPQMTQRYAHLLDAALRRGANVADKVFGNGKNQARNEHPG